MLYQHRGDEQDGGCPDKEQLLLQPTLLVVVMLMLMFMMMMLVLVVVFVRAAIAV